ncbi:MAG: PHB depolymerase family esterase [Hyphomicrobiaceae bacterium]
MTLGSMRRCIGSASYRTVIAGVILCLLASCKGNENSTLPSLQAKLDGASVSGLSSGAYMAGQFQIAYSSIVSGAALIAGGPYACAENVFADALPGPGGAFLNLSKAMNGCMLNAIPSWPDPARLAERVHQLETAGRIDPAEGLKADRIYLFSGTKDKTVVRAIVDSAATLYRDLGVPEDNIKLVSDIPAGHAFVTAGTGASCGRTEAPYIVDCGYDQAAALLTHIYGSVAPASSRPEGEFLLFDQREFTRGLDDAGLDDVGVAYIPPGCRNAPGCRVHVAFHGCAQNRAAVSDAFIRATGFARLADTNRLIVLFPQVKKSTVNPQACWDWWGYTGRDYLTRNGPQIVAVKRMLDRLAGRTPAS